jgi:hypothetical protein
VAYAARVALKAKGWIEFDPATDEVRTLIGDHPSWAGGGLSTSLRRSNASGRG